MDNKFLERFVSELNTAAFIGPVDPDLVRRAVTEIERLQKCLEAMVKVSNFQG